MNETRICYKIAKGHHYITWPPELAQRMSTPTKPPEAAKPVGISVRKKKRFLYVTSSSEVDIVKFGITSGDWRNRLSMHWLDGFDTIQFLSTGIDASSAEIAIKDTLKYLGYNPAHGLEYFSTDCLPRIMMIINALQLPNNVLETPYVFKPSDYRGPTYYLLTKYGVRVGPQHFLNRIGS